jgi:hypothetical protein
MAADITNDRALGGNLRRSFRRKARTSPGKILRLRYLRTPTENAIRYPADMAILLQQDLANITPSPLAAFFEDLPEIHRRRESRFCELHHDECCAAFLLNRHFCKFHVLILRPVEIHREFITAAARWMMAAKL